MSGVGAFDMGPAGKVSPLIKTARWGLLLTGIWWGHKRYQINKAREEEIRAYNLKMKPVWDAEKAVESAKANREQLLYLAKETGTRVSTEDHDKLHSEILTEACALCRK